MLFCKLQIETCKLMALGIYLFYCGADHDSDLTSWGASPSLLLSSCDFITPIMFILSLNCYIVFPLSIMFLLRTLVTGLMSSPNLCNFILTYMWIISSIIWSQILRYNWPGYTNVFWGMRRQHKAQSFREEALAIGAQTPDF